MTAGDDAEALLEAPASVLEAARQALTRIEGTADLFVRAERTLSLEYEPEAGWGAERQGQRLIAAARVWTPGGSGRAAAVLHSPRDLDALLDEARHMAAQAPQPEVIPSGERGRAPPPGSSPDRRSSEHALQTARALAELVGHHQAPFQAVVVRQAHGWSIRADSIGGEGFEDASKNELLVRIECARGAVVDALQLEGLPDAAALTPMVSRLDDAVLTLRAAGGPVDRSLPWVLRPPVAAPVIAALVPLLTGSVTHARDQVARLVGKKAFPSALAVVDDAPGEEVSGDPRRDDEGTCAGRLLLIDRGQVAALLHTRDSAFAAGALPNGRCVRAGPTLQPQAAPNQLAVLPTGAELPRRFTELCVRTETFTTVPRPGVVTMIVAGWEVCDGARVRAVAPFELELPLLPTLRRVRGAFGASEHILLPERCTTPSLLLDPPVPVQ